MADQKNDDTKRFSKDEVNKIVAERLQEIVNERPRMEIIIGLSGPPNNGAPKISIEIFGGDPDKMQEFGVELGLLVTARLSSLRKDADES